MNNNLYWAVYKNLERELIDLSNLIHIDDKQLEVYSIKITELLIRTVVEVESITKELYFQNGGTKPDDNNLFFDTDCLDLLENKWFLSKKQVLVSATNFYFNLIDNKVLTPLKKANKRGSSSSDWLKAYQAVKHNRAKSLTAGNLKNLIRAMAGLYVLNLYYKDDLYELKKDSTGISFDSSLGSIIFSIKVHKSKGFNAIENLIKSEDFDECVYLIRTTDETRNAMQDLLLKMVDRTANGEKMLHVAQEYGQLIKEGMDNLKNEAILNKQQY